MKTIFYKLFLLIVLPCFALATDSVDELFFLESRKATSLNVYDPFEKINRSIFDINISISKVIMQKRQKDLFGRRLIKKEKKQPFVFIKIKNGIFNFLDNLSETSNAINFMLQKEPEKSFRAFWRFMINSSIGFLGLIDIAELLGLEKERANFEQTMVKYGVKSGPYFVIPVFGSYSLRRIFADIFDVISNPLFFLIENKFVVFIIYDYNVIASYANYYELIFEDNIDTYARVRAIYLQGTF